VHADHRYALRPCLCDQAEDSHKPGSMKTANKHSKAHAVCIMDLEGSCYVSYFEAVIQ
jgi:hypothetical protein